MYLRIQGLRGSLRHCVTSRKVEGSIPDGVDGRLRLLNTVIPRLTSDPANEIFRLTKMFFRCFSDSANEYGFG